MSKWAVGQHWDKAIFHLHFRAGPPMETIVMSWSEWYEDTHDFYDNPGYARNRGLQRIEGWVFDIFGKCTHVEVELREDGSVLKQVKETEE